MFPGGYHLGNGEAHTLRRPTPPAPGGSTTGCVARTARTCSTPTTTRRDRRLPAVRLQPGHASDGEPGGLRTATGAFEDGTMRGPARGGEGRRVHSVGVYTSPYLRPRASTSRRSRRGPFFGRVGNPELVAVLGECFALARDVERSAFNEAGFEASRCGADRCSTPTPGSPTPRPTAVAEQVRQLRQDRRPDPRRVRGGHRGPQGGARRGPAGRRRRRRFRADAGIELRDTAAFIDRLTEGERPARAAQRPGRAALRRHGRGRRPAGRGDDAPRRAGGAHPRVPDPGRRPASPRGRDRRGRGRRRERRDRGDAAAAGDARR